MSLEQFLEMYLIVFQILSLFFLSFFIFLLQRKITFWMVM